MPKPITLDQPITFDSLLCRDTCINLESTDGSFCFQLPLFDDSGTNLLSLTEVDLAAEFTNSTTYNPTDSTVGATCGSPVTNYDPVNSGFPTVANQFSGNGKFFHEVTFGDITINYGINPVDDVVGKLRIGAQTDENGGVPDPTADYQDFTEADANSTIFWGGTNDWDSGAATANPDIMELIIAAKEECDDTDERVDWDLTVTEYSLYPAFYETTFTASNDTFYRLHFKLDKTSNVRVFVTDSGGTDILEDTENGPVYDKIFKTGTLPSTTVTIRWEITTLTEWPNANFNESVLTEVSIVEVCPWGLWVETSAGVYVDTLTETHDTTSEIQGTTYNDNIQYCYDLSLLSAGDYRFRALNSCDLNETYTSATFKICDADCDKYSLISWDHGNIKFMGANKLDYFNYTYVPFFRARVDFQDLTQQFESVNYRDAAGYLQNPYTFYRNVQIMQISEVPGYMRRALAMALTDVFMIDGVEYRKLDDEDISPLFQATDPNAVRILVTKVGDFTESKNV